MPTVENIWDAAIAYQKQKLIDNPGGGANETTLLVVGSKNVGKTTLIHRLLERQEAPKPTLALEYTFGRKKNQGLTKDVCHVWELGGGTLFANLLETPISPSKLNGFRLVLMVDLSEPHHLWFHLEALLSSLQGHLNSALKRSKDTGLEER